MVAVFVAHVDMMLLGVEVLGRTKALLSACRGMLSTKRSSLHAQDISSWRERHATRAVLGSVSMHVQHLSVCIQRRLAANNWGLSCMSTGLRSHMSSCSIHFTGSRRAELTSHEPPRKQNGQECARAVRCDVLGAAASWKAAPVRAAAARLSLART